MKTLRFNIILLLAMMFPLCADAINTKVESVSACPGSEVAVPLKVTDLNGISAISLALSYDADKLEYLGYQDVNGNLAENLLINENNGRIMLSWYSITPINISDGCLLWLRFNADNNNDASLTWITNLCEYADVVGNVVSSTFTNGVVSVYDNPIVTSNPESVSIYEGLNANFQVSANGYDLDYQWQLSVDNGLTWDDLQDGGCYSNVTTNILKVNGVTMEMNGYLYRCMVNSSCGNAVYSGLAMLSVNEKPTFIEAADVEWSCNIGTYQDIMVEKFNNVGAFSLVLNIDTNYIEFVECINLDPALSTGNFMANQSGDKLYISYASVTGVSITAGKLFSILFNSQVGTSFNTWQLDLCEIADIEGNVINAGYKNGSFSVISECALQSDDLVLGWNWFSSYIELEGINGIEMLQNSLGDNCEILTSQTAFTTYYDGYGWYGSLTSINNESMYRMKMINDATIVMQGAIADPAQHPITMTKGWNYIGYISTSAMDVSEALAGLSSQPGDLVKTQKCYCNYYEGYGWYGSLSTIYPGDGLMYKSVRDEAVTFTYPSTSARDIKANLTAENNHWVPNMRDYSSNMTLLATVHIDDVEISSENYELAVFSGDECRGSIRLVYAEPIGSYVAFLTIAGDEQADLSFRLYNTITGEENFNRISQLTFNADDMIGSPAEPFVVSFSSADACYTDAEVYVYPNPAKDIVTISFGQYAECSSVNIYSLDGRHVVTFSEVSHATSNKMTIDISYLNSGLYIIKVKTTDGREIAERIVKM